MNNQQNRSNEASRSTQEFRQITKETAIRTIVNTVCDALREKGYDPINQFIGYLCTEDPTYITSHNKARTLISSVERDDLLRELLKSYLDIE
ncbi:MAG: IreB family regulatory phosphoprotein [Oscillospiraceae bacterium]|jgi:uncharacterized protein (UPF0297 family)|nr:IreB family regulatory phosphoprotein [Oscillospiraceae bacterium]